jgi:hypothetical protein
MTRSLRYSKYGITHQRTNAAEFGKKGFDDKTGFSGFIIA